VKTVTIALPPGDNREADARRFMAEHFPLLDLKFIEDPTFASPRAVALQPTNEQNELELMEIDSAIFRHFNPIV
jgi:hypothetical protein